jgi:hypothetical protein
MKLRDVMRRRLAGSIFALLGVSPLIHADLQDDLNARWRGAWVIVTGELYSNCNGMTTDNRVSQDLISGNGRYAFAPGELARVTKVDVNRRRVDVFLDIQEGMLLEYRDGPFTLYREASCPVELLLEYGDARTRDLGVAGIEPQFNQWFERHARLEDAEDSPNWNGRLREDYPEDYALTLTAYQEWKAEQYNRNIDQKIESSTEQTSYLLAQVSSDSEFGAGLGYGIAAMREDISENCNRLVASVPTTFARSYEAPNPDWGNGYKTGQQLAYHIELSRRLRGCYLDPAENLAFLD